jgi:rare lipoprotein A (peptidoglycan hydrolase)
MVHIRNHRGRTAAAMILTALVAVGTATTATAHPDVDRWWQYDKETWTHSWRDDQSLSGSHQDWHATHPGATQSEDSQEHQRLYDRYLAEHFHAAISSQSGEASWYDADGQNGACGKPLSGLYAASRTLPCGSLVSVRSGDKYVIVTILDRGPYGSDSRILDLSAKAFGELSPLGAGVIDVKAVQLQQ